MLLVDDEENILSALTRLLRPRGYRLFTASSGQEALDILEQTGAVDLVISDMRMPQMNGAEFLEQVADRWPGILCMLLTGYSDLSSTVNAINKGKIFCYLGKPWDDEEVLQNVQHALDIAFLKKDRQRLEQLAGTVNEELTEVSDLEKQVEARRMELEGTLNCRQDSTLSLRLGDEAWIRLLSSLIDLRPGGTRGQSGNIATYAYELALNMGMDEPSAQDVRVAGLLHNIGKAVVPDAPSRVLPGGNALAERADYAIHPIAGQAAFMAMEQLGNAAGIIRSHCENFDGSGYPDGIRGDQIPLGARILAVVIDYFELREETRLPGPMGRTEALARLVSFQGALYDPEVVNGLVTFVLEKHQSAPGDSGVQVLASQVEAGMVLSRDLWSTEGMAWLPEGEVLTQPLADCIRDISASRYGDFPVHIHVPGPGLKQELI